MKLLSNLSWPETPFGADKRPFVKHVQLLAGFAMQWAEDAGGPIPVSAASVFLPVKRTQDTEVRSDLLHFGYRVAVLEDPDDAAEILRFTDRILVQARRHSAGIAWHAFGDDLHVTQTIATERLPGFTGVGEAWKDREERARGIAPVIDTAWDLGQYALPEEAAVAHGIQIGDEMGRFEGPGDVQTDYDLIVEGANPAGLLLEGLAFDILSRALVTALLGGRALQRLHWDAPFKMEKAIELEAWHALSAIGGDMPAPTQPTQ
ncbi:hypothetical protein [Streptomyces sp. MZ04]|uniref:hypothetical protein n=1 Tax=Streptomyces sp. MZ04 TaxID=2559236 RepID=UPI00107EBA7D|nr:hypothetical protein [Streptomyces sp. MZ04]TGA91895.1 hypothetical protein E2651_37530 [Streptomyces sp. MZ04]